MAARRKEGSHLAGFWEFPGGKIESGEGPEECLARELYEEFGITAEIGMYIGESIHSYGNKVIRLLAYKVTRFKGTFQLIAHDAIQWCRPEDLAAIKWAPADIALVNQYKAIRSTEAFYIAEAESYALETLNVDVSHLYPAFTTMLPKNAHILDLGCGCGRDSQHFLQQGYQLTAIDFSPTLAAIAEKKLAHPVKIKPFSEIQEKNLYDGIWANASLLHSPKGQIREIFKRLLDALKNGGLFFMSFKFGLLEEMDPRGRFFNNYTQESLTELLASFPEIAVQRIWENTSCLRGANQKWVNAIVKKCRDAA